METVHWSLDAVDASTAEESLRGVSPNTELRGDTDPRHRLRFHGERRFWMLQFELAGEIWGANEPDDAITVPYAVSGRMDWEVGDERGVANLPWVQSPTTPTFARCGSMTELAMFFDKADLRAHGRAFYGDDTFDLDFAGSTARSVRHAAVMASTLKLAYEMAGSEAFEQPLPRTALYRLLALSLSDTFRLDGDHRTRTLSAEGRDARYRRASQFIEDYASLPITVEGVAAAVDVGTLELEATFRGHSLAERGVADQLRATRLAAAHEDLKRADPTLGDTVREIAHRWGFASPSRFAAHYCRAYGITPKWTLDR